MPKGEHGIATNARDFDNGHAIEGWMSGSSIRMRLKEAQPVLDDAVETPDRPPARYKGIARQV